MSCDPIVDRLPWFANGTLDEAERLEVEAHLNTCEACRRALDDTVALGSAALQHLPIDLLLDLADGVDVSAADAEWAGRHLAACRSCTAELVWARRDDGLAMIPDVAAREAPRHGKLGRRLGPALAAAALLALAIVGLLVWQREGPSLPPIAVAAQLELLPETPSRGSAPPPMILVDADSSAPVAVVLISDVAPPTGAAVSIELVAPDGEISSLQTGLAATDSGLYTVVLPPEMLATGESRIVLRRASEAGSQALAVYRFRVVASDER